MVWGTSAARRHAASPDPELVAVPACLNASPPPMVECARCDSPAVLFAAASQPDQGIGSPDGNLPRGWILLGGSPHCPDCARTLRPAAPARCSAGERRTMRSVGPKEPTRHRGCRIGHEIALGMAAIQIRAGASAPQGRDEAVQFLLDAHGLDELIIEISAIRAQLTGGLNG